MASVNIPSMRPSIAVYGKKNASDFLAQPELPAAGAKATHFSTFIFLKGDALQPFRQTLIAL
jgi:hypothetical protein